MSRPKRDWYPGATYHVMSRGNRRLTIYKDEDDYLTFLESILRTKELYPFVIHSLCLMTNHFHMEIETKDKELGKIIQCMLHPHSMNFNKKYHYTGHLFEGRYTARLIEDERYFLEVSRYIHLNPVKAQIVREPLAYKYSSYSRFMERGNDPEHSMDDAEIEGVRQKSKCSKLIEDITETDRVLSCFTNNPREQYRLFV